MSAPPTQSERQWDIANSKVSASASKEIYLSNLETCYDGGDFGIPFVSARDITSRPETPVPQWGYIWNVSCSAPERILMQLRTFISLAVRPFRNTATEQKKIVIDRSRWLNLRRCSVHLLPIAASITLTAINLKGYFVGANFTDSDTALIDTLDTLILQVVSKLMELLIVASLATIVADLIRYEILFGRDGLPFGLLNAASSFQDISFFLKPGFWYSWSAITSRKRKLMLSVTLAISGLIAVFAGPSSALLMIPNIVNWPGGGADFWLIGNSSSLWPSQLGISSVGGSSCLNPTPEMLSNGALNASRCIWYSTTAIAQELQAWNFRAYANLSIVEATYKRTVGTAGFWNEKWAASTNAAVGIFSDVLASYWWQAIEGAPLQRHRLTSHKNYRYRIGEDTVAQVKTPVPVVRTVCNLFVDLSDNITTLEFPVLPEYERTELYGPNRFRIPATAMTSSQILTRWLPMIEETTTTTTNGSTTSDYPSAFLSIQFPYYNSTSEFAVFACSVDARWALGNNIATNLLNDAWPSDSLQHGEVLNHVPLSRANLGNYFLPVDDGSWSKIGMDLDWLNALTPLLSNSSTLDQKNAPGFTSYAALLSDSGIGNSTGVVTKWGDVVPILETSLAVIVVEGLARIGFSQNVGSWEKWSDHLDLIVNISRNTNGRITDDALDSLLRGDGSVITPPAGVDVDNLTKLRWDITISGYGYKADSIGFVLAIVVLITYVVLALAHLTYSFQSYQSSSAWSSFEDMMVLSHSSQPDAQALRNTSAGVSCHSTLQRKVRIRVAEGGKRVTGHEQLQLLFDDVSEDEYSMVECGKEYGSID